MLAVPALTVTPLLTALDKVPSVAVSVYAVVLALSILQPANVATPDTAVLGFAVHVNVAPPGVVSANVTELESDVTVLPPASCTVTTGCAPNAVPPVAFADGCVLKTSFDAVEAFTANADEVALVIVVDDADNV